MHLFVYGSLVNRSDLERFIGRELRQPDEYTVARLCNFRRKWNVGSVNKSRSPEEMYYVSSTGERFDGTVCFLGLEATLGGYVNGVVLKVSEEERQRIDLRERRYNCKIVTDLVQHEARAGSKISEILTYVPKAEPIETARSAIARGTCAIPKSYLADVIRGFQALGVDQFRNYLLTTDPAPCETADLVTENALYSLSKRG